MSNGVARSFLTRLVDREEIQLSAGAIDPVLNPAGGPNAPVMSSDVQLDGKVLICGVFTLVDGQIRTNLARLNTDGTLDTNFNPVLEYRTAVITPNGLVAHAQPDGTAYIGGTFSHVNGFPRSGLARLNPGGTVDQRFQPGTAYGLAAAQPDGKVITKQLTRLNRDGSVDTNFVTDPSLPAPVTIAAAALQSDGKILGLIDAGNASADGMSPTERYELYRFN